MYISAINGINAKKASTMNSKNNSCPISIIKNNKSDLVTFGAIDPISASILKKAADAAKGVLGVIKMKGIIAEADELFNRYNLRPAIETALGLDIQCKGKLLVNTDGLLNKAVRRANELPDDNFLNRELKQQLLEHCYLDKEIDQDEDVERLLINLDNKYHGDFKKYLLKKLSSVDCGTLYGDKGLMLINNIDKVMAGVGDSDFKVLMKNSREKQIQESHDYVNEYMDSRYADYHDGD